MGKGPDKRLRGMHVRERERVGGRDLTKMTDKGTVNKQSKAKIERKRDKE